MVQLIIRNLSHDPDTLEAKLKLQMGRKVDFKQAQFFVFRCHNESEAYSAGDRLQQTIGDGIELGLAREGYQLPTEPPIPEPAQPEPAQSVTEKETPKPTELSQPEQPTVDEKPESDPDSGDASHQGE